MKTGDPLFKEVKLIRGQVDIEKCSMEVQQNGTGPDKNIVSIERSNNN